MTSGVSCVLALTKDDTADVVDSWRKELDNEEKSLRTQYATNQIINSLHGSDSHEDAIKFVFLFMKYSKLYFKFLFIMIILKGIIIFLF